MKKIILFAFWPIFQMYLPVYAQKEKKGEVNEQKIIIIKKTGKEKKYTIETKDGEVLVNGKPSSEYKDDDITVITGRGRNDFSYPHIGRMNIFNETDENKSFLGVTTEKTDNGVKIKDISKGSAAEKSGLKEGDIITKIGNKNIMNSEELMDAVSSYKPKDVITIHFTRNGKSADVKATLGEKTTRMRAMTFSNPHLFDNEMFKEFNFINPPTPAISGAPFKMFWGMGQGHLGIRIEDTDNDAGAKIINVEKESVAEKAGMKTDDIITEINGKNVTDVMEVRKELGEVRDKNNYTLKARRNGTDIKFEIRIPKRKNSADL